MGLDKRYIIILAAIIVIVLLYFLLFMPRGGETTTPIGEAPLVGGEKATTTTPEGTMSVFLNSIIEGDVDAAFAHLIDGQGKPLIEENKKEFRKHIEGRPITSYEIIEIANYGEIPSKDSLEGAIFTEAKIVAFTAIQRETQESVRDSFILVEYANEWKIMVRVPGETTTEQPEEEVVLQPVELEYKGVWMPAFGASTLIPDSYLPEGLIPEGYDITIMEPVFADLDKAEQGGINTFAFQMGYWVDEQGELSLLPGVKEYFVSFIEEAHARGFKIWLNPEILHTVDKGGPSEMRIMPEEWLENTNLIENYKLAIIETAKFAEEHDVEIFSPSSEMYVNIGRERSLELLADIKPDIDAVYSGKICVRGEWPKPELLSYSCFGPTVGIPKNEEEEKKLIDNIDFQLRREDMEVELIFGELWEGNDWQGSQIDAKGGFIRALEVARGKVSGIFILDTGRTYKELFPESFETTIKEFYSWI